MNSRHLLAATLATTAVLLAGCGRHDSASSPGSSTPAVSGPCSGPSVAVDHCDPDALLLTAAERVFSYRPANQATQAAAFDTAADLLDPTYRASVGPTASVLAPITAADWQHWADEHAVITATAVVTPADHPADTPTQHLRVLLVTQHISTGEPDRQLSVYMAAARPDPGASWAVTLISPR